VAGVLREDREAGALRRSLVCSRCAREWDFPRILCPRCREERPEKLPRFAAEEIPWVRLEACDSCRRYLKAIDLSRNPAAEPLVDELGATPLDLAARERGYEKIAPNLAGI
jgi:FdhE protein